LGYQTKPDQHDYVVAGEKWYDSLPTVKHLILGRLKELASDRIHFAGPVFHFSDRLWLNNQPNHFIEESFVLVFSEVSHYDDHLVTTDYPVSPRYFHDGCTVPELFFCKGYDPKTLDHMGLAIANFFNWLKSKEAVPA
jgi:hypothetical protein